MQGEMSCGDQRKRWAEKYIFGTSYHIPDILRQEDGQDHLRRGNTEEGLEPGSKELYVWKFYRFETRILMLE